MKTYTLSFPCIYPVCPLSIDHSRLYLIGDIYARYYRNIGYEVIFPIGFHYSGLTAHKFNSDLKAIEDNNTKHLFEENYKCSQKVIERFKKDPKNILDYYSYDTLSNLKYINVSFDVQSYYTTDNELYSNFVRSYFNQYYKHNVILKEYDNLYLDYNNDKWKERMIEAFNDVNTIKSKEVIKIKNAIDHLQNVWKILKTEGIGVQFKGDERIIDSMHDSELLSLFDIINHVSKKHNYTFSESELDTLFCVLINGMDVLDDTHTSALIRNVIQYLPTNLLIAEEHLKVWLVKKVYSESLLFQPQYRTTNWFITGLGMRNNMRMSSSMGTAVLLNDLIHSYGPIITRMIILMTGGHPSRFYNYDENLPNECRNMYSKFRGFLHLSLSEYFNTNEIELNKLFSLASKDDNNSCNLDYLYLTQLTENHIELRGIFFRLDKYIQDGFFRHCMVEVMTNLPKQSIKYENVKIKIILFKIMNYYLKILLGINFSQVIGEY
jgi:leucyl-tRNA synthetase